MDLQGLALAFLLVLPPLLPAQGMTDSAPKAQGAAEDKGRCKIPSNWDSKLRFAPSKTSYALNDVVQLSCAEGYQPSVPALKCVSSRSQTLWNGTATCKETCQRPQWDQKLQLTPNHKNYQKNEEVKLSCPQGLFPDFSNVKCSETAQSMRYPGSVNQYMWLGKTSSGGWIRIQEPVKCNEKCWKPIWDPKLLFSPDKTFYGHNEVVVVSCPEGHWPPPMEITCVKLNPRQQYPAPQLIWHMRNGTGNLHRIEGNMTCVELLQVVPGTLEVSASSIKLNWTCRFPHACQQTWAMCRLAWPASPPCEAEEITGEEMLRGEKGTFTCPLLQPFTVYSVTISLPPSTVLYTRLVKTEETVPDKPEGLVMDHNTGLLKWKPLPPCKGEVLGYQLNITARRAHDGSFLESERVTVNASVTQYLPPHQRPGSKYTVEIQGLTAAGAGDASVLEFQTYISVAGQALAPWPWTAVTLIAALSALVLLCAGILWFVLSRKKKVLISHAKEDLYTELQPYENLDSYSVIKKCPLADNNAGKHDEAEELSLHLYPQPEEMGRTEQHQKRRGR
ncbi:uncharacterized protein LOC112946941 [Nothoprocta perdicaria]|uniref:uncharacterized protein LOC112946941 n=1 Tax=Nothoprocta perdicaria TaxID=30464 RepID=UPI000E1BDCB7|nr:uncharacterized protein LOC112946941 [Nothoprocta perdicaria]